ncbi:MAG: hypothetical protein FWG42_12515 [Clostridiales bacterium]|nr:hypothetical protein [Clostridiales bacterium]
MPRRNNRKDYSTGKAAAFFNDGDTAGHKPECSGCAFAGFGGTCTTSDGECLISQTEKPGVQAVTSNASRNQ